MRFGLINTPATFQGYIIKILTKKLDIFVIVYLNNILIYTKNWDQPFVEVIYWVLDQFQKYFLFTNLKKYYFYHDKLYFLGYEILSKKIYIELKQI